MKYTRLQRRLALGGAILLILLYLSTLVFALMDHPLTPNFLMASVFLTVVVPVSVYGLILITRMMKK